MLNVVEGSPLAGARTERVIYRESLVIGWLAEGRLLVRQLSGQNVVGSTPRFQSDSQSINPATVMWTRNPA